MQSSYEIISLAWREIIGESLNISRLSDGLMLDFGVDACGVTKDDVQTAIQEGENCDWANLSFACREVLWHYKANSCSTEEFVRSLAAMCILSNAIRRGFGDMEFSFDAALAVLVDNSMKCGYHIRAAVLSLMLRCTES